MLLYNNVFNLGTPQLLHSDNSQLIGVIWCVYYCSRLKKDRKKA